MPKDDKYEAELDDQALERSLPTLTEKLRSLQEDLSEEEQAVFSSIVSSAALHLEAMQAISTTAQVSYAKPISAVATVGVRQHLLDLPETLGLTED